MIYEILEPVFFSILIQETKDPEGKRMLNSNARGAQDSNLVNVNKGVCFNEKKSSFFCQKMEHKFVQDALLSLTNTISTKGTLKIVNYFLGPAVFLLDHVLGGCCTIE
jgi:hypothetical protein